MRLCGAVVLEVSGSVATVTLSNPGKLNAMSRSMWRELREVFLTLQNDRHVRCVLLRGEGGHFCAGGDISEYASFRFSTDSLREFHEVEVWGGLQALLDCDVPIVAQILGNCMGAGLEMASCCDLRIASASARFGAPIAKLGFPMAPREAALVMRAVGDMTAREMLLSAAILDADNMKQRGFLGSVVSDGEIDVAVQACVDRICSLAPTAARLNKQIFRALAPVFHEVFASESIANVLSDAYRYADRPEHREGVMAFIEKRQPQF